MIVSIIFIFLVSKILRYSPTPSNILVIERFLRITIHRYEIFFHYVKFNQFGSWCKYLASLSLGKKPSKQFRRFDVLLFCKHL